MTPAISAYLESVKFAESDRTKLLLVECLELAVVSLKFACGDRCAHQNPCDAKEALDDIAKLIAERVK